MVTDHGHTKAASAQQIGGTVAVDTNQVGHDVSRSAFSTVHEQGNLDRPRFCGRRLRDNGPRRIVARTHFRFGGEHQPLLLQTELGRPFKPSRIVFVEALPKTRSAKILRRAVRAVAVGEDPGDMSSAENPQSLDQIRSALG